MNTIRCHQIQLPKEKDEESRAQPFSLSIPSDQLQQAPSSLKVKTTSVDVSKRAICRRQSSRCEINGSVDGVA
jgi:hypothetical protein